MKPGTWLRWLASLWPFRPFNAAWNRGFIEGQRVGQALMRAAWAVEGRPCCADHSHPLTPDTKEPPE